LHDPIVVTLDPPMRAPPRDDGRSAPMKLQDGRPTAALRDMPSVRYRPIEVTDEGSGFVAYRCYDTLLGRPVRLLIAAPPAGDDYALEPVDFLARAQALVRQPSSALPKVFEFGYHGARPFLVLQAIAGGRLAGLLADGLRLPPRHLLATAVHVALALETLHSLGLVHGDLGVGALVLEGSGRVRLTDFGQLRALHRSPDDQRWPADDVRQLGVMLLSLTMGATPWGADIDAGLDAELDALIEQLLDPDPGARPTSSALVERLLALSGQVGSGGGGGPSLEGLDLEHRVTRNLPAFSPQPEGVQPPPVAVPDHSLPPSRLAGFINTISLMSARWGVGKPKPDVPADLVALVHAARVEAAPPAPAPRLAPLLALLAACLCLFWALDRAPEPRGEPALAEATGQPPELQAAVVAPAPPPVEVVEPTVRDGRARVVYFRDGERVGAPQPANPWERQVIPETAVPIRQLELRPGPQPLGP